MTAGVFFSKAERLFQISKSPGFSAIANVFVSMNFFMASDGLGPSTGGGWR